MVNNVINPLTGTFGSRFVGVMGWQFADDGAPTYAQSGAWANGIGQALDQTGQPMIGWVASRESDRDNEAR